EMLLKKKEILVRIQEKISAIELKPEIVVYLMKLMNQEPFRSHGVFVRSDTNAEDLPGFVGAGLNETVPNVRGIEEVIRAIKRVWASPFTEKAFTWREDLIENPWEIFPSVVIQAAVDSEKA